MISFPAAARIVVAAKPVEYRRGGESLAALAKEVLKEDTFGKMSQADPARSELGATPLDTETVDGLRAKVSHLEGIITGLKTLIGQLKKTNDELRALKFGKGPKKLPADQFALGFQDIHLTQAAPEAQIERLEDEQLALTGSKRRRRDPHEARASLPAHLPVVEEVLEPKAWNALAAMGRFTGSERPPPIAWTPCRCNTSSAARYGQNTPAEPATARSSKPQHPRTSSRVVCRARLWWPRFLSPSTPITCRSIPRCRPWCGRASASTATWSPAGPGGVRGN